MHPETKNKAKLQGCLCMVGSKKLVIGFKLKPACSHARPPAALSTLKALYKTGGLLQWRPEPDQVRGQSPPRCTTFILLKSRPKIVQLCILRHRNPLQPPHLPLSLPMDLLAFIPIGAVWEVCFAMFSRVQVVYHPACSHAHLQDYQPSSHYTKQSMIIHHVWPNWSSPPNVSNPNWSWRKYCYNY